MKKKIEKKEIYIENHVKKKKRRRKNTGQRSKRAERISYLEDRKTKKRYRKLKSERSKNFEIGELSKIGMQRRRMAIFYCNAQ